MNPDQFGWIAWVILFLPLAAAGGITLFTLRDARRSAALSIGAVSLSFALTALLFIAFPSFEQQVTWLDAGDVTIGFGIRWDALSSLMMLIVTGVGGAIHIYSVGYMHGDRSEPRYFAGLSLFTFSMSGIVLATNFVQMFIFWELVGLSSYLLIGFWFERPAAADASKKAFLTNRLGDFGFLLGILVVWGKLGTLDFGELGRKLAADPGVLGASATVAGLLIFCGAMGKSAQFPLHVWLPDAMEGPTPVSALIHAATMVAAGVYMLCRVFFLYTATPAWPSGLSFMPDLSALTVIAWIGGLTALLAALIAVQQSDIKRILAYSTLSQLGLMVMAVGLGGATPAMYHLTTHAFFKALLFLGAGSVIHALHHEQDIWKMGGLAGRMPVTFLTFLVGTLALTGAPGLSGFFSKDLILAAALDHGRPLFVLGVVVSLLTTFYMFRLVWVAFLGPSKSQSPDHAHESPAVMTIPLVALAVPSVLAGYWHVQAHLGDQLGNAHYEHENVAVAASVAVLVVGFILATWLYRGAVQDPLPAMFGGLARAMRERFYFDELYEWLIARTHDAGARLADAVDRWIIAGMMVRGVHGTTELIGRALRLVQTGNLQTYAFLFAVGAVFVLYFALR